MHWLAILPALLGLCVLGAGLREPCITAVACVLLINWGACSAVVFVTTEPYPWQWFFLVDYLSALTILIFLGWPCSWRLTIGCTYGVELLVHVGKGMAANPGLAEYLGYYILKWTAWGQVAVVAAWGACELYRRRSVAVG